MRLIVRNYVHSSHGVGTMFNQGFSGTVHHGETIRCEVDGFEVVAKIWSDDDATAPWKREDGHGPVSSWRKAENWHDGARPMKAPGEMVLHADGYGARASFRLYDFAEACRIARRDGWGFSPAPLVTKRSSGGRWYAWFGSEDGTKVERFKVTATSHDGVVGAFETQNEAITALYAAHRATMTARQYASRAALADFERLRKWCDDQWEYVGISVTVSRNGIKVVDDFEHALWGVESDAADYLTETANELLSEALESARENIAALCA